MAISTPTTAELEILQILWQHGAQTVRFVHDELLRQRADDIGYTTTLKNMQNMLDKGILLRRIEARSHIYCPAHPEAQTQNQLLQGFVEATYRGSAASLVLHALGKGSASPDELAQIKALIEAIEHQTPKN